MENSPPLSELDRVNLLAMLHVYGQDQLRELLAVAEATGRPEVVRLMHLALSLKGPSSSSPSA